ncbi:hypothetical protein U9476_24955, partial [Escherichia coli]
ILTFQNHTNRPLTDFGGKTSIFSHPVYLFLREFSLQDFRGGSDCCDREALHWAVTTGGFDSETVQDVMLGAVERRFGNELPASP